MPLSDPVTYKTIRKELGHAPSPSEELVIFYSAKENGTLWCPYCEDVEGLVESTFKGKNKPAAVIYSVGSRAEWKNVPSHPVRHDFGIERVPTILRFKDGKEVARLGQGGITSESLERIINL